MSKNVRNRTDSSPVTIFRPGHPNQTIDRYYCKNIENKSSPIHIQVLSLNHCIANQNFPSLKQAQQIRPMKAWTTSKLSRLNSTSWPVLTKTPSIRYFGKWFPKVTFCLTILFFLAKRKWDSIQFCRLPKCSTNSTN